MMSPGILVLLELLSIPVFDIRKDLTFQPWSNFIFPLPPSARPHPKVFKITDPLAMGPKQTAQLHLTDIQSLSCFLQFSSKLDFTLLKRG